MDWKLLSIMLIVLIVLENLFFVYITFIGYSEIQKEGDCKLSCLEENAASYEYGDNVCACYDIENNLVTAHGVG